MEGGGGGREGGSGNPAKAWMNDGRLFNLATIACLAEAASKTTVPPHHSTALHQPPPYLNSIAPTNTQGWKSETTHQLVHRGEGVPHRQAHYRRGRLHGRGWGHWGLLPPPAGVVDHLGDLDVEDARGGSELDQRIVRQLLDSPLPWAQRGVLPARCAIRR